jgi:hypothetical protein
MKTMNIRQFAGAGLLLAAITFTAWKPDGSTQPVKPFTIRHAYDEDTTLPRKKTTGKNEYRIGDLDQAMKELDRAMVDMDKNLNIDFSKMDKEMKMAMEEIKKIDFNQIAREVEASLKKVDWEKTRVEVDKALREVQMNIKEVDVKKIQQELEKVQENLKAEKLGSHIDMEKIKRTVDVSLAHARTGIENAKKELALLKEFTESLEKDGLINKKKGFKIEIRNGEMYINGAKQSKEVNDRYRKYFKEEDYSISSDGEERSSI